MEATQTQSTSTALVVTNAKRVEFGASNMEINNGASVTKQGEIERGNDQALTRSGVSVIVDSCTNPTASMSASAFPAPLCPKVVYRQLCPHLLSVAREPGVYLVTVEHAEAKNGILIGCGDGTLTGPFGYQTVAEKAILVRTYPSHMPLLEQQLNQMTPSSLLFLCKLTIGTHALCYMWRRSKRSNS